MMRIAAALSFGLMVCGSALAQDSGAEAIALPEADRAELEKYLGQGVVGKAIAGNPIAEGSTFFPFVARSWTFRFTSGDMKGKTQEQSLKDVKTDGDKETGLYQNGEILSDALARAADGSVTLLSESNSKEGVVSHFAPPEPIYVNGMQPGDSKSLKVEVKVYDLDDPDEVTHSGSLDLTYSYIGAYEVTVPAGTYQAALLKWVYDGKVGPATVEDTQYRFLADGVGVVAMVEKKNISALLVYHDDDKYGKVLVESP